MNLNNNTLINKIPLNNNLNNSTCNSSNSNNSNQIVLDNDDDSYEITTQELCLGKESNYQSINRFYDDLIKDLGLTVSINKHWFCDNDKTFEKTFEKNCKALRDAILKPSTPPSNNLKNYNNFTKNLEKYNNITCTLYEGTPNNETIQNGLACIQKSILLRQWALSGTPGEKRLFALRCIIDSVKYKETILDLSGLNLTDVPPDIEYFLPCLKVLDLNNNKIKTLDSTTFKSLTNLETICLKHNQINELPPTIFEPLTNLEYLFLNHNQLKQFNLSVESKKSLKNARVFLLENPFDIQTLILLSEARKARLQLEVDNVNKITIEMLQNTQSVDTMPRKP